MIIHIFQLARTFVRRTRVRRTKNPTLSEDVVLIHVLLYVYEPEKVVHIQKYEAKYPCVRR